ncbi:MAG: ABC transporter ATP-binding protein, partial [Clostridia bacterium]
GKSTLIKMIAGMIPPTSGEVLIQGLSWSKQRSKYASRIGYMPDDFQFPAGTIVREWLSFYASLRHASKARVDEMLERVGLSQHAHKACTSLSKGMRQRLMLAQAAVAQPEILLLDEPTNGLDLHWIDWFVGMIGQMKQAGQTVLFSTHQLEIAVDVADVLIFMHGGKMLKRFACKEQDREEMLSEMLELVHAAADPTKS